MKNKSKVYIIITQYETRSIKEERLYLIEGIKVREYINGKFQPIKMGRKNIELFVSVAHAALIYHSKNELTVKRDSEKRFFFKEKRADESYDLRDASNKIAFLSEVF